ncbi:hypothetical protein CA13_49030 [Planctomycetes bacterium CA13]|uniref:Uncharacterized protein n=1 Tax=Novipirellula herctigrandis TaxID=2527986 RepID=A0A5C5Z876_9BACT|nr:hypothetical protein CA13_49030 [Planctomycetes bacterium CA13]
MTYQVTVTFNEAFESETFRRECDNDAKVTEKHLSPWP